MRTFKNTLSVSLALTFICVSVPWLNAGPLTTEQVDPAPATSPAAAPEDLGQPIPPVVVPGVPVDPSTQPIVIPGNPSDPNDPSITPSPVIPPITLPIMQQQTAPPANNNQQPGSFNGPELYKAAFESIRDTHIMLADDKARETFVKEWENKYSAADLDSEEKTDKAVRAMLASQKQRFDSYLDVEDTKEELNRMDPSVVGIGAALRIKDQEDIFNSLPKNATEDDVKKAMVISDAHPLLVEETVEGSPAEKSLEAGDQITHVDSTAVNGLSVKGVVEKIRGSENTSVSIRVKRTKSDGTLEDLTFSITRKKVVMKVVHMKDCGNGVNYIKLDDFMSKNALTEMAKASVVAADGKALIIDLRGNGGGRVDFVLTMASFYLPEGTMITMRNRVGNTVVENSIVLLKEILLNTSLTGDAGTKQKKSISPGGRSPMLIPEDMPIIVLVNQSSASASEILSGALQKRGRAIVMGKTTLGKGVGQTVIELPFKRRLHVTNFEFMPGGMKMDWVGIIPNIEVNQTDDFKDDRQLDEAITKANELVKIKEARDKESADLKKAKEAAFQKYLDAVNKKDNPTP